MHDLHPLSTSQTGKQSRDVVSVESPHDPVPPPEESSFLDLKCDKNWPPLTPPAQNAPCPYNFRSMGFKPEQNEAFSGLDQIPSQGMPRGKRGRKSDISKEKLKAKIDVAHGKQYSIPGVLRAVQTLEPVKK